MAECNVIPGDNAREPSGGAAHERVLQLAEGTLDTPETEFRNLADSSPGVMGIFRLRPDGSMCMPYASSRIWELYGLGPEDVVEDAEPLFARTHPDDAARVRDSIIESAENMTPWRLEFRVVHPTRGELWLEGYSNPKAHSDGGIVWYGFIQEITDRKRAEASAQAVEERMRLTFEAAKIGTGEWDLQRDRITCSDAMQRVLALPPGTATLTGEEYAERLHPEDRARLLEAIRKAVKGERDFGVDYRVVWPDGTIRWMTSRARTFYNEAGRATRMLGALMDITERKLAEDELQRTSALLRSVITETTDAVMVKDRDSRYVMCNEATARALDNRTIPEVIGKDDTELFDAPSARSVREHDRRVMEAGAPSTEEAALTTLGGVCRIYIVTKAPHRDERGRIIGVVGIAKDVTQRRQADEALRRSEELLRRAEALAHLASWTLNAADGVIHTSDEGCRLFGWDAGPHRVEDLMALVHPDDRPRVQAALEAALQGTPFETEHRIVVGGEVKWLHRRVEPETDAEGRVVRLFGVSQDITARRRLEEQFRQAQKMEAIGTLAGGIAHDFNNVLTIIGGYSDEVLNSLKPGDPNRDMLAEIKKAGERARSLTRQLLMFSRQQVVERQVLDLNTVVADAEKMLRRLLGEDIVLTVALSSAAVPVKADRGQLEQVLMNLAVNARDAMPQGGQLTIQARKVALDDAYAATHPGVRPGEYVMLGVSDTGVGIDPKIKPRIFEPFFTTKGVGKGTGLGLPVVHGVVLQSGGHIDVSSEVGKGTTFSIYLPAAKEALPAAKSVHGVLPTPRGSETVLLVEDEGAVRTLTRRILERCGYTVVQAADGQEAVRVADSHVGPIHLLVSDVVIPHLGGRQLAQRLTALKPGMKVLFVSGYTDDAVVRHGVLQAEFAFLQKPFTPNALAQKVRDVLDDNGAER